MKSFLISLQDGLKENSFDNEQRDILRNLTRLQAVVFEKGLYKLKKNYICGKIDLASNGNGFLEIFSKNSSRDLLIEPRDLKTAMRGDIVICKKYFSKSNRPKAKVLEILQRKNKQGVVYTKKISKNIVGINIQNGLSHILLASQKSLKALPPESVLKIDFETGAILEVLGVLSDPKVDEKIALAVFEKEDKFSELAELEALSFGNKVDKNMYLDRVDLTNFDFCTIDPTDAKDFDDAIYFDKENLNLFVAIADVSEYVTSFSNLDKEAKKRGFSIYFPHMSVPMLPRNLSENICSLKPNEDRLCFCFKISLDENGGVKKTNLINAIINSKKRYSYDQIDDFLQDLGQKDEIDEKVLLWLVPLNEIIKKIRKNRLMNAFEFETEEIRMQLDENLNLLSTRIEAQTPSHALIEDCMLLANKAAAKRIDEGIFRNHEEPDFAKIEELLADLENLGLSFKFSPKLPELIANIQEKADSLKIRADVDRLIIKSQKKACYEHKNKGHFGLGFDRYTHFTSPIRRYSDLILHRLLKAQLKNDKKQIRYLLQDIENVCENLSLLERESDKVALFYMDRKFARWAYDNIGKEFEAIVTDVKKNIIAKIDDKIKGARVFLIDDNVELLERIKIKITQADIITAKIYAKVSRRIGL